MKIELNKVYYFDVFEDLQQYLSSLLKLFNDAGIKYICSDGGVVYYGNQSFTDKLYSVTDTNYIVFDNDKGLQFSYNFFSMIDVAYIDSERICNKVVDNEGIILDLDVTGSKIVDFEIERFSDEYIINPSTDATRPAGGDYFKEIVFHLDNNKKICICAENAEFDGYCDIWVENNCLMEMFNGQSHKVWWEK